MVSKFRRDYHALLVIRAHAILPQVPRRMGHEIPLQGIAGPHERTDPRDYPPNLQRNGRAYRARCSGPRPYPHVFVDPAEAFAVRCHAAYQRQVVAAHPDGVSRIAKALLGQTVLGAWIFLDNLRKCHRRYHHAVSGITFRQMMLPASAGSASLTSKFVNDL